MRPKVSVVVTVFKAEQYLEKCLNSITNQTLLDIELILVNDGSPDHSPEICNRFAENDKRIKVIHQVNQGNSAARNRGTAETVGEYIMYVDCDDWLELNACEIAYREAVNGKFDVVFWQTVKEYENKSILAIGPFSKDTVFEGQNAIDLHRRVVGPVAGELKKPHLIDSFISVWGKLYKSELIKYNNILFIDTNQVGAADIFFCFQLFSYVKRAKYLHQYLIHYRKDNPNSMTKNHGSNLFKRFQLLFDKMDNEIKGRNLPDVFSVALRNRICISMMNIGLSETSHRNKNQTADKIKNLKQYLNSPRYRMAFRNFELQYLVLHWKLFFTMCKWNQPFLVYVLLKIMAQLRRK